MKKDSKKRYSIAEAAKLVNTTSETLRHYDRIGLLKPSLRDEWTSYRYYNYEDIIRLQTIKALQQMDLPLKEIKKVLSYNDLEKIVSFLSTAEDKAHEKIKSLNQSLKKIRLAKESYLSKIKLQDVEKEMFIKKIPSRVILMSNELKTPSLDNLYNYLSNFYKLLPEEIKGQFTFEDNAGIYEKDNDSKMFAICKTYKDIDSLTILPEGNYLCSFASHEDYRKVKDELINRAKIKYQVQPNFIVTLIIVRGILSWDYELQIYLG